MALDTPATVAVIGAGPLGLEAALYTRFLGYAVVLLERGRVAERWRSGSHELLAAPFAMHRSTLGLAALRAQDESYEPLADDHVPTAAEWISSYLDPLAKSDLVVDGLRVRTEVASVAVRRVEQDGEQEAAEVPEDDTQYEEGPEFEFELQLCDADGQRMRECVDAVIDTTGSDAIESRVLPDVSGPDAADLATVGVKCPSPHWYRMQSSSQCQDKTAAYISGLDQIRAIFADIGGRADLDLYKTIQI